MGNAKTQMQLYFAMVAIWRFIKNAMEFPTYRRANGFVVNVCLLQARKWYGKLCKLIFFLKFEYSAVYSVQMKAELLNRLRLMDGRIFCALYGYQR